ncbi:hypothetical protein R3P38DRAFT_2812313 [Favolaschia claudopus]|uniref:Uncharacterized protein n=1 Tax=Favolaschia claudopus TaxID=2862362 RepID=A0AAV9Z702_9AGAR
MSEHRHRTILGPTFSLCSHSDLLVASTQHHNASMSSAAARTPEEVLIGSLRHPFHRRIAVHQQRFIRWQNHMRRGTCYALRRAIQSWTIFLLFFLASLVVGIAGARKFCLPDHLSQCVVTAIVILDFIVLRTACWNKVNPRHQSLPPTTASSRRRALESKKLQVLIQGPFRRPTLLYLGHDSTVHDIILELRRRRLIPDLTRIRHNIYFATHHEPLKFADKLCDVGICDMSMLYIRMSVLGGSRVSVTSSDPEHVELPVLEPPPTDLPSMSNPQNNQPAYTDGINSEVSTQDVTMTEASPIPLSSEVGEKPKKRGGYRFGSGRKPNHQINDTW